MTIKFARIWDWEDDRGNHGTRVVGFYIVIGPWYYEKWFEHYAN